MKYVILIVSIIGLACGSVVTASGFLGESGFMLDEGKIALGFVFLLVNSISFAGSLAYIKYTNNNRNF